MGGFSYAGGMLRTRVVHVYGPHPWDVYIGRPMFRWKPRGDAPAWLLEDWRLDQIKRGHSLKNPFKITAKGEVGMAEREDIMARYRESILSREDWAAALEPLRGKTLACWCKACPPFTKHTRDLPCHGDVLLDLLGEEPPPPKHPRLPL